MKSPTKGHLGLKRKMFIKRKGKKAGGEGGQRRGEGDGGGELRPVTFTSRKCAASLLNGSDVLWYTWCLGVGVGQGRVWTDMKQGKHMERFKTHG